MSLEVPRTTLRQAQGTEYFPDIRESILFLEDDHETQPHTFDRDLQSLIHQPAFSSVKALIIGRFETPSNMTDDVLRQIIGTKAELKNIPVVANMNFGHSQPMITFPIGGTVRVTANLTDCDITVLAH